jgi:serine/threonine-protein kinase
LGTAAGLSYLVVTRHIRGHEVAAPNLTGQTVSEALEELAAVELSLAFEASEYDDVIPEGAILRQRPRPGRVAKAGTSVKVVVSRGPEYTATPDVVGFSLVDAGVALRASDLTVGGISRLHSATVPPEDVIAQSPAAGEGLRRTQAVNLLVSLGPEPTVYSAPTLIGLTLRETEQVLAGMSCEIGDVTERTVSGPIEQGTVIDQTPRPGAAIIAGEAVDLVVGRQL